jgi:hypothetical protein
MSREHSELDEFRRLVELGESLKQMDRIESRIQMPKFIERVGLTECERMFAILKKEVR